MVSRYYRAYAAVTALSSACALWGGTSGCVQQRPARNNVYNENQYLRKDFLIAPGDGTTPDQGWFVKSTILSTSTPNVLANVGGAGLFAGAEGNTSNFIRFQITQDKLQMLDLREISNDPTNNAQGLRTQSIVNEWPITNVDLKYQVNLDGEKTNLFQENQELDWQVRQWVKINFANNNMSDLYAYSAELNPIVQNCVDSASITTTLVTDSFLVDTVNNVFEFTLNITAPISYSAANAATCAQAFGATATEFFEMGRQNVSLNLRTMFVRPSEVLDNTYIPMPISEKDPIQHKYGAFQTIVPYRDTSTQLLGAQQFVGRFNPAKPIVYYLSPGMPTSQSWQAGATSTEVIDYPKWFHTVLEPATNAVLTKANPKSPGLKFLNYNDLNTFGDGAGPVRQYGDPRYSFINWHSDLDNGSGLLGIAQFFSDPRTGQTISASVNLFEGNFVDTVLQRLDMFLQTVGAEFLTSTGDFDNTKYPASCTPGTTVPLVPLDISTVFNQQSTVYGKMQNYLNRPFATYGYLSPADFIPAHDADFYNAYYAVLPYQIYADPQANLFVTPQAGSFGTTTANAMQAQWQGLQNTAQFLQTAGQVDQGVEMFDPDGPTNVSDAVTFMGNWGTMARSVTDYEHSRHYAANMRAADELTLWSYFDVYQKNGRHCMANGMWEDRATYVNNLIGSLNEVTAAHEFGHTLGLRHNFMGSVDQPNYPLDTNGNPTMYSSSVMDYNQQISEAFFETDTNSAVWGSYDRAALGFIYGNNLPGGTVGPQPIPAMSPASTTASGQVSPTIPWNDPLGWNGTTETSFLYCSDEHTKYTPLCRRYDMGSTPAEIMANDIQRREWNYLWTNFRLYHKYFSTENYATSVANDFNEMRRFFSLWAFDWSGGELSNDLRLIGTAIPPGSTVGDYYTELTNSFNTEISMANQLQASYHRAIIEQSSGERPFITSFDPFYGDVTQQGIQLDKLQATSSFSELWPAVSNYDPSQAAGLYFASAGAQVGDAAYTATSQQTLADFLGAAFATYRYSQLGPIANFAASTHSSAYSGNLEMQTWVGGWAFNRERDFLDYVHQIAVTNDFNNCDLAGNCSLCTSIDNCNWDPRIPQASITQQYQSNRYNIFQGPDGRTYIWGYIASRNQWVLADRDRNNATYTLMLTWTTDIVNGEDDGYNGALFYEYSVRFDVDSFTYYDGNILTAN